LLQLILDHSRPWFASLVLEDFEKESYDHFDATVLEKIAQSIVCKKILQPKAIFMSDNGKRGQLCLFLNKVYAEVPFDDFENTNTIQPMDVDDPWPSITGTPSEMNLNDYDEKSLINSHFACLSENSWSKRLSLVRRGNKIVVNWKPYSVMPTPSEDLLLHLLLTGLPMVPAFAECVGSGDDMNLREVSLSQFMNDYFSSPYHRSHSLPFGNANQKTRNGDLLESIGSTAICVASHVDGYQGSSLLKLLDRLIYLLTGTGMSPSATKQRFGSIANNMWIPFLSVPDCRWPGFLKPDNGFWMGTMTRTSNSEMIDGKFDLYTASLATAARKLVLLQNGGSFEFKNHGVVDGREFVKILMNIPEGSVLHIVITRKMQDSYFTKQYAAENFRKANPHIERCIFYRFNLKTRSFDRMTDIETDKTVTKECLVFFIEVMESFK
jgi:hypothetical protein